MTKILVVIFASLLFSHNYLVKESNESMKVKGAKDAKDDWLFQIGRNLFYDSIFSKNYDLSCATCHQQRFAFGYSYDVRYLSKEDENIIGRLSNRDILPLFNLQNQRTFMWDGQIRSLEEQISRPIRNKREFNNTWTEIENRINRKTKYKSMFANIGIYTKIDSNLIIRAIVSFERQLISMKTKYDRYKIGIDSLTKDELKGLELVSRKDKGNCLSCHDIGNNKMKSLPAMANNGFNKVNFHISHEEKTAENAATYFKIKVPQLRNWIYTAPYGHSGNLPWIEFVLNKYSEGIEDTIAIDKRMKHYVPKGIGFTKTEKKQILAFLYTLNDSSFVNDIRFSKP